MRDSQTIWGFRLLGFLTFATTLTLTAFHSFFLATSPEYLTNPILIGWVLLYSFIQIVTFYVAGLPEGPRTLGSLILISLVAATVGAAALSLVQVIIGDIQLPRFVSLGFVPLSVPIVWLSHQAALGSKRAREGHNVLLVGNRHITELTEGDALASARPRVTVIGQIPRSEAHDDGLLRHALRPGTKVDVLVLTEGSLRDDDIVAQAATLHEQGVRVQTTVQFYEERLGKLPIGELGRSTLFFNIEEVHGDWYPRAKRVFDLVGATLLLIPLVISIPFVLLGNLFGNQGPLFFRQERVGKGGEVFLMTKFRTMRPDSPSTDWTQENDPRITPFGKFLRHSHVDELPQVIQVLKGVLSLVGPRPEQPKYVAELDAKLPYYHLRHLVRPGITGWAQVMYPYGSTEADALQKLQYEFYYLSHQSLMFDIRCLGRTIRGSSLGGGR